MHPQVRGAARLARGNRSGRGTVAGTMEFLQVRKRLRKDGNLIEVGDALQSFFLRARSVRQSVPEHLHFPALPQAHHAQPLIRNSEHMHSELADSGRGEWVRSACTRG